MHVAIDTSFCEHSLKIDRFVSRNQQQLQKNVNPLCKVQSVNLSLSVGAMFKKQLLANRLTAHNKFSK